MNFSDEKFNALKITKSLKKRHHGILEEVKKEIKMNEKYMSDLLADHEKIRWKKEAREEAFKVKLESFQKNRTELKQFKKEKQGLLDQLVGTGQKKKKVKDMSLGSESTQFVSETPQNIRVLERLIDDNNDMNKKLEKMGLPLESIKEELTKKPKKLDLLKKKKK
jgi:hypothetical protein